MSDSPKDSQQEISRVSLKSIWKDFLSIMNLEKGVLYTLVGLLLSPRKTTVEYLKKDRSRLAHPMRLLVFSTVIYSLINIYYLNSQKNDFDKSFNSGFEEFGKDLASQKVEDTNDFKLILNNDTIIGEIDDEVETETLDVLTKDSLRVLIDNSITLPIEEFFLFAKENKKIIKKDKELNKLFLKHLAKKLTTFLFTRFVSFIDKMIFLLVPLYALFTFLFFRKKSGYNYAENLVSNAYLISFQNSAGIITFPLMFVIDYGVVSLILSVLLIGYTIYYWMVVNNVKGWIGFVKSIFVMIFSYVFYFLVILVIMRFYLFRELFVLAGE